MSGSRLFTYKFLIEQYHLGTFVKRKTWQKLLEEVLGIGEPTAKKIIALAKGNETPKEPKQIDRAKADEPVTAQLIQDHLKDERFELPCLAVLKKDTKKAGLQRKMSNVAWTHLDRKGLPIKAEVNEAGRKPILVIFGAFVVISQRDDLHAKLVEEDIVVWPLKGKTHVDQPEPETGDKRKRTPGRSPTKSTPKEWKNLPKCVKDAKIAPDYNDYHDNFNADLFERLFERLCKKNWRTWASSASSIWMVPNITFARMTRSQLAKLNVKK
ncbi:hypothetical protein BJV82DRAFT_665046 [Fennellomyces sp. T-0311]|nr:hypothetical protein BJV82DRAFT_665046 [Fennellomyces sp. T-0311]